MGSDADVTRAAQRVSTRDEADPRTPQPAPPMSSVLAARQKQDLDERRQGLIRFMRMAVPGWTVFVLADFAVAYLGPAGTTAGLKWLIPLRLVGFVVAVAGLVALRKREHSHASLTLIEGSLTTLGAVLVSVGAIQFGGLGSHLVLGVLIVAMVRSVVAAPWRRALPLALACVVAFPVSLAVASLFVPTLRAQWTEWRTMALFSQNMLLCIAGAAVGAWASHLQWAARREVFEARRLGNYRLKVRIGGGGMGDVWLARQDPLGREVALKLLRDGGAKNADAIRRFEREARAASSLTHPNTIRVFDFGASDDGVFYIAMELLDGLDMEALVRKTGPLPPARAIHLLRQACLSLAEAHHAGIVHCDVKPANLFVAKAGNVLDFVKVLDFGLVHVMNAPGASTIVDSIRGTPSFMPPEAVRGERVGPESDVYSLGAVLYFMVTATTVFRAQTFHEMALAQVDAMPESPSQRLGSSLPADLETVILRCLSKARGDRYATAKDLEEALGKCAAAKGWTAEDARASWALLRPSLTTAVTKPG